MAEAWLVSQGKPVARRFISWQRKVAEHICPSLVVDVFLGKR